MTDGSHFVKNFKKNLKLRIDLKWPEMRSKVIFGHPKWPPAAILSKIKNKVPYGSEMARNAIESEFRTSKMADQSEMRSKVIFRHPKWPPEKKNLHRSEMARIAIKSYLRTSKMAAGGQFVKHLKKIIKLRIDLKWPEMRSKVKFGHPKWPTSAILSKISKKN